MLSIMLKFVSGLMALYIFLRVLLHSTQDSKEPPPLETFIPFLGPMIGMRKKGGFYIGLRDKFNLPIYTLRIPFLRLYIINSTALIPIVQKQVRILDFAPVEAKVAMNVMGASAEGRKILVREQNGQKDYSYAIEYDKAIHPAVTPGPQLDAMNRLSIQKVAAAVEILGNQAPRFMKLFEWVQKEITIATTDAVYGPHNPFKKESIQEAYRKFEPGIITLLLDLYPNLLARESVQGRKDIVDAFHEYFVTGAHEQGSAFVKAQYQHKMKQGVSGRDIASFEIGGIVAILSNTIPAAFWVLYHTICDENVLAECRKEILACCQIDHDTYTLDITRVKASCALLLSTFKESLRFHGIGTSVRMVTQDHLLDGKFLLKEGGIIMIPGPVQHSSSSVYGDDVNEFQHKRFMKSSLRKRPDPVAFRGFGGGSTLCPGRHFATTEVLTFVALMIVRFDFEPVGGSWNRPETDRAGMAGTVAPPNEDVEVRITPIAGELAGKRWDAILSGSNKGVEISAEDMN